MNTTPAIRLTGITKTFGESTVVQPLDLEIATERVLLDPRPFGLRQDDAHAHDRGIRDPERR